MSSSSTRKGSDAFLLSASHKDSQRNQGGAGSWAGKLSKLVTGEEDESTGSIILAIIVIFVAVLLFFLLGGQSEPSSASQEIAELDARYRLLLSSHKEVLKELDGLQKRAQQPDPNEKEIKALQKEVAALLEKYKKVEGGEKKFAETTSGLKKEVQGVKEALAEGKKEREAAQKKVGSVEQQLEALRAEALRVEGKLTATADDAARQKRLDGLVEEAIRRAVKEAEAIIDTQRREAEAEAEKTRAGAVGSLKEAVREELLADVRALLEKIVGEKVVKEIAANKPTLSFSPFSSRPDAEQLEQTVKAVLAKIYEERLGQVDWLLEINGASIEQNSPTFSPCKAWDVRCQLALQQKPVQLMPSTLLKVDWASGNWWSDHSGAMLGNCWAMNSTAGHATMRLKRAIAPESFVMQHVPPSISPDQGGSAPHKFRILGWLAGGGNAGAKGGEVREVPQSRILVEGEYQISDLSVGSDELMKQIQYFPVKQEDQTPIDRVQLEVLSNHGKEEYTCLYHLRLYGTPAGASAA